MTANDKKKASSHMKKVMANKDFKYSIYRLYVCEHCHGSGDHIHEGHVHQCKPCNATGEGDKNCVNWQVFRQEMFKYFGCTKGDSRPSVEQMDYIKGWAKRFKNKRDKARLNKLD